MLKSQAAKQRLIKSYGATAFEKGRSYETKPYSLAQPSYRLWWSQGYNEARACNREEAIKKASRRAKDVLGLDVSSLRVPFLEGDE